MFRERTCIFKLFVKSPQGLRVQKLSLPPKSAVARNLTVGFSVPFLPLHTDHATAPKSYSTRLVYVTAYVTGLIMMAAYAAAFVSFVTVQRYKLPFVDFKGLLKDGTYHIGLIRGTGHMEVFRVNT